MLVWLLSPGDFGLVAMTTALMNVLQMVSEFGVGVAVIQKKDMSDAYVHTAFWINFAASLLILGVAWISAPWIARFYGADEISLLVRVTSLGFPVTALRTIPMSLLRRRMQFGLNSALETTWNGLSGAMMIVFALLGASYWSLVVPAMIVGLVMTPFWFAYAKWKPALSFDWAEFGELFSYSKNLVGASLLSLILSTSGFVIAGHLLGKDAAGHYNVAMTYSMVVLINFAWLIGNVSLSGFSAKQGDEPALRAGFIRIYELLAATMLPVHLLGIILAPMLFSAFMPEKYMAALVPFQVLTAFSGVRALAAHLAPFYNSISKAYINFYFFLVSTPISIAIMYTACRWYLDAEGVQAGLNALAWATALTQGISILGLFVVLKVVMAWQSIRFLRLAAPYLVASILGGLSSAGFMYTVASVTLGLPRRLEDGAVVCVAAALGFLVYFLVVYTIARPKLAQIVRDAIPNRIREQYVYSWLPSLR
ncbi:MAG: lipopolysaccharide biosynthesis protein [Candidatus Hydrogenedentota bacterium]